MSHRKAPFHFDDSDPLDKSAWKRFGFRPEEERKMFFETTPAQRWPDFQSKFHKPYYDDPEWRGRTMFSQCGSDPDSPSMQRMRGWNSGEDGSVPIKVVHERTPPRSNDDGTDSETSSQASHGSQGSSGSQPQRAKITREPRVHHIPIMVEPREGSTSSGYASDHDGTQNHDGEFHDQQFRNVQQMCKDFERQQSPKPESPRVSSVRLNGSRADSPSRTTPVFGHQAETFPAASASSDNNDKPGISGSNSFQPTAPPRQRTRNSQSPSSPQPTATSGGPHVTRISMNVDTNDAPKMPEPEPEEKPEKKAKTRVDSMILIADIVKEVTTLEKDVEAFSGMHQDKRYRYLDEMLTRCMLKLDNIETEGRDDIRQSRKGAIREVQKCINQLESKIRPAGSNVVSEDTHMDSEASVQSVNDTPTNCGDHLQKSASEIKMEIVEPEKSQEPQSSSAADEMQTDALPENATNPEPSQCQEISSQPLETEKQTDQAEKSEPQKMISTGQ